MLEPLKRLEDRLAQEFKNPVDDADAPLILEEPSEPKKPVSRLYVVWDLWEQVSLRDRSEIIMNAFVRTHKEREVRHITVAMGLTAQEARLMHLID